MKTRRLTLEEVEFIAHRLAVEMMSSIAEPIPPFSTVDSAKLESSISAPFQTFDGKYLYEEFIDKVSALFYLITKNHCFENGNKRMAVTTTVVFCYVNNRKLDMGPKRLYELACDVAQSKPSDKSRTLEYIKSTLSTKLSIIDNLQK